MKDFLSELKRRNVYKVAVAYAVVSWLTLQAASLLFATFEAPPWAMKVFVIAVALGFPVALVLAWAFEITPEGIKRAEDVDANASITHKTGRKLIAITAVLAVIAAGLFVFQFLRRHAEEGRPGGASLPVSEKSIAVLPFDNLSRDPDNAYFAEGVQDEILTRLAKVADLKVISRTSTQRFKSAPSDLRDIAKQLGVMNILEGSVQKAADQVRVNVQLINAMTDAHLWADTYDRKLTDIFAVESDIAKSIVDMLQAKLTGSEKQLLSSQATNDTVAYELYHKGRSLWEKRSGDNILKAIDFYQQALARDPNYASAYAGLANAYVLLPYYTSAPRRDAFAKAREAALKALQLDPDLAEAHVALGKILHFADIDLAGSAREFERAIELKPNDATAHHWLGSGPLLCLGLFDECIRHSQRAVELNPLSSIMNADLGLSLYTARRCDEAIAALQKALSIDPTFAYARQNLGITLQTKGDLRAAIKEYEKAKQYDDDPVIIALGASAKALVGDKNIARKTLHDLDEISKRREVVAYARALLHLSLGDKQEAISCLERGYEERDGANISGIKVDPLFDSLHGDPRFEALVQKVTTPKEADRR